MRLRRIIVLSLLHVCTISARTKKEMHTQQFSQDFLQTVHNNNIVAKPTTSNFNVIDTYYLHAHHTHPQQPSIEPQYDYWKLKYGALCLIAAWCIFKTHQGLSCVVGETISTKIFKIIGTSIWSSCYWTIKKLCTDFIHMLQKLFFILLSREIT